MGSTVQVGAMEITSSTESAAEMLETLAPKKEGAKEPKALVDRGKPVPQDEKSELSKAASEMGKAGGAAAAEAREKAKKEEAKGKTQEAVDELERKAEKKMADEAKVKAEPEKKVEAKPEEKEHKAGDPRFDPKARIDELTKQRRTAERERDILAAKLREYEAKEAPQSPTEKPTRDKYESDEDYAEALADYKVAEKEREAAQRRQVEQHSERIEQRIRAFNDAIKEDAEFVERVDPRLLDLKPAFMVHPSEVGPAEVLAEALIMSEFSRELFYHLTEHPEEVEKLLKAPNAAELRAGVGRIEGRIEAGQEKKEEPPEPKPEKESKAPVPFKPLAATSSPEPPDITNPNLDFDSYMRLKRAKR